MQLTEYNYIMFCDLLQNKLMEFFIDFLITHTLLPDCLVPPVRAVGRGSVYLPLMAHQDIGYCLHKLLPPNAAFI